MNYETTITAETQDDIEADVAAGHDSLSSSSTSKKLVIAGLALLVLLGAIAAYYLLAGGEPAPACG